VAVASFTVAVNERKDTEPTWWRVTLWREKAEALSQYISKGDRILCAGRAGASAWVDDAGKPRFQLELTAFQIDFMGSADRAERDEGGSGYSAPTDPESLGQIPF
jgi:single-stranded DNA-binding protein